MYHTERSFSGQFLIVRLSFKCYVLNINHLILQINWSSVEKMTTYWSHWYLQINCARLGLVYVLLILFWLLILILIFWWVQKKKLLDLFPNNLIWSPGINDPLLAYCIIKYFKSVSNYMLLIFLCLPIHFWGGQSTHDLLALLPQIPLLMIIYLIGHLKDLHIHTVFLIKRFSFWSS